MFKLFHSRVGVQKAANGLASLFVMALLAMIVSGPVPLTVAHAAAMKAPGSRVKLDLPAVYEPSQLFRGFLHPLASIAFVVNDIRADAYDSIAARLKPDTLAKNGLTDIKTGTLGRSDTHFYVWGRQIHPDGNFIKHYLLLKRGEHAALIRVTVPEKSLTEGLTSAKEVGEALKTAVIEDEAAPSDAPFAFTYLGPFRERGGTQTLGYFYAADTKDPIGLKTSKPNVISVVASANLFPVARLEATDLAKRAWKEIKLKDLKETRSAEKGVGGLSGYTIEGTGLRTTDAGEIPVEVRQIIAIRPNGGYFRILVVVHTTDKSTLMPELDKVLASFKALK